MLDAFTSEQDTGIFTPNDLTSFVIAELSGDLITSKELCLKSLKNAKKKLK